MDAKVRRSAHGDRRRGGPRPRAAAFRRRGRRKRAPFNSPNKYTFEGEKPARTCIFEKPSLGTAKDFLCVGHFAGAPRANMRIIRCQMRGNMTMTDLTAGDREALALAFAEEGLEIIDAAGPDNLDVAMKRVAVLRERAARLHPQVFGDHRRP